MHLTIPYWSGLLLRNFVYSPPLEADLHELGGRHSKQQALPAWLTNTNQRRLHCGSAPWLLDGVRVYKQDTIQPWWKSRWPSCSLAVIPCIEGQEREELYLRPIPYQLGCVWANVDHKLPPEHNSPPRQIIAGTLSSGRQQT